MTVQADRDVILVTISRDPATEAWQALVMGGAAETVRVLGQARSFAARLEQELAETRRHLEAVLANADEHGSTRAHDTAALDDAQAWLDSAHDLEQ